QRRLPTSFSTSGIRTGRFLSLRRTSPTHRRTPCRRFGPCETSTRNRISSLRGIREMPPIKGAVRRSQLVTTYGVGAVVALADESFMVTGIDRWGIASPNLHEPRLERELMVHGFVAPPATDGADIPVVRFPRWYSCPKCRRLDEHRKLTTFESN